MHDRSFQSPIQGQSQQLLTCAQDIERVIEEYVQSLFEPMLAGNP